MHFIENTCLDRNSPKILVGVMSCPPIVPVKITFCKCRIGICSCSNLEKHIHKETVIKNLERFYGGLSFNRTHNPN